MIRFTTKLFLILAATLLPTGVWGQEPVWKEVSTVEQLKTALETDGYIKMTANIGNGAGEDQNNGFTIGSNTNTVNVNLDLNGYTLSNNYYGPLRTSVITIYSGSTVIIQDSNSSSNGNGNITGGISQNSVRGGGIHNYGTLTIQSGKISGNNAERAWGGGTYNGGGGAIYNESGATLTIAGGEIYDNRAHQVGGIYNAGTLYLKGGYIHNNGSNTTNNTVDGIHNTLGATLYISGDPKIENNSNGNIYLPTEMKITIDGSLNGNEGDIGIKMQTPGVFTQDLTTYSTDGWKYFKSDDGNYDPYFDDSATGEASFQRHWPVLVKRFALGGTITLDKDYVGTASDECLTVPAGKSLTLDLNGHTLNRGLSSSAAQANGCVINNLNSLTITGTGTITGGKVSGNGGAVINAGTLDIQGGTFTGNSATANGGAIFNTGTTTISGGSLTNNSAAQGGAIYNSGTLTISAGNISSNTATTNGGGIYHYNGTLNISGAPSISGNQKSSTANNIYLASGKQITINGDLSNTTTIGVTMADGVGVFTTGLNSYAGDYNKFESDDNRFQTADATGEAKLWTFWAKLNNLLDAGGTINLDRNYVPIAGYDDTYLSVNSDITLNLNTYTINRSLATAIVDGYVIKVASGHTLTIAGTGTITGGNNTGNGGGILNEGTLVLSGGSITGNIAATGGGIYNGGTLQMSGAPTVKNNTGGNIYLPGGHATITLNGTLNGTDGNIGITMQTPGTFTSGLNTYGTIAKFASDNSTYIVALSANEATLMTPWAALKAAFAAGGDINLTRNYTAPAGEYLTVDDSKTVTLDLKGRTIDRGLSSADADANGYVIKVNTGSTLTIKDTGSNGRIIGGKVSGNGGAITNAGTLNIQGGTITGNSATGNGGAVYNTGTTTISGGSLTGNSAVNGGAIYNSGTLIVSGGSIQNNTATTNGGAIYHNGPSFSLQGSPTITSNTVSSTANNVYLATTKQITISGGLSYSNDKAIGIATEDARLVFTTGLSGNGNASKFTSNQTGKGIGLNSAGEAIFGTSYTITRNDNGNSLYLFIKNDWYNNMTAVEGEYVRVRLEASNGGYVPISLYYTDGTLSSYPEYSTEYTFTMPNHAVTITGLGKRGGYCGATTQKNIKYYLDGTTLRFVAKDASDYQMANYVQTTVPWSSYGYSAVDIPNNVTNIGDYAFFGSNLATIDLPSTVTSIGTFAFGNCQSLTNLTVNGGTSFEAEGNVLYNYGKTNLICYPAGKTGDNYTLPATVTTITDGAFAFNTHLQGIIIGGGSNFSASNDEESADYGVLFNSDRTTLVYYPAKKTGTTYKIPTTATTIAPYAFHYCNNLQRVYLHHGSVPTGGEHMFDRTTVTPYIMVKDGLVGNYQVAANWSSYSSRIKAIRLSDATITLNLSKYNNEYYVDFDDAHPDWERTPDVTSVISNAGDDYTLVQGIDYTVEYSNNVTIGQAIVTITGINNYEGVIGTQTFNITRELTISGATGHYSTYFNSDAVPLVTPSGLQANKVTVVNFESGTTTIETIGYIPAGTPVLLYASSGNCNGTYHLKATTGDVPGDCSPNYIGKGEGDARDYEALMDGKTAIYVLRGDKFYRAYSGTLPANRCYIAKPTAGARAIPDYLEIGEGDGTTGLKSIENGELKIDNYYDLSGRRVLYPTKGGVYIYNGKKIVIK